MIRLSEALSGSILDVGGGGEAVIGRRFGRQVTAIDRCPEELAEAPDGFEKVVMDAACMSFPKDRFDHATFFYTLMYMNEEEQRLALAEAFRVVKPGGQLHIWDCAIASAYPEPFLISVEAELPSERISTCYGIVKSDPQSAESVRRLCEQAGWTLLQQTAEENRFYLRYEKEGNPCS